MMSLKDSDRCVSVIPPPLRRPAGTARPGYLDGPSVPREYRKAKVRGAACQAVAKRPELAREASPSAGSLTRSSLQNPVGAVFSTQAVLQQIGK